MTPRWSEYFLEDDFGGFWSERAKDPSVRVLVILGLGFDPRCLRTLEALSTSGLGERLGYIALRLVASHSIGDTGSDTDRLTKEVSGRVDSLPGCRREAVYDVETHDAEGHTVAGRQTLASVSSAVPVLSSYTDVVVDISGLPRGVFFPLLAYLVKLADRGTFRNLHVSVVEDPELDSRIRGREYGQAEYLHTFRPQSATRLVWLPVLGMGNGARLEKIHDLLKGACIEICPVLPFPARSLRRADDIALSHAELLFEGLLVSPENMLLCDERTPFDVYRKILDVEEYYRQRLGALPEIGPVTTVVSPLSSKTLSLGALLAAIERALPVCHVEPGAYDLSTNREGLLVGETIREPTEIWLAGEPYLS